jgi:subtilisin family serine protease
MKRILIHIIVAVVMMPIGGALYPQTSIQSKPRIVPGQVVIKYKRGTLAKATAASLEALGITVVKSFDALPFVVGKFSTGKNIDEILHDCRALPNVEYAEPNYLVSAMEGKHDVLEGGHEARTTRQFAAIIPNDPRFNEQWHLNQESDHDIDAPEAWDITVGSSAVVVGIVDTGLDYDHEDLQDNIWINPGESGGGKESNRIDDDGNGYIDDWRGWDFANRDNDPFDDNGNGTHTAGIVGAVGNNGKGVAGVNWKVKLMALKFLGGNGSGSEMDAAEAIIYATNNGAKILSNSWGGGGFSQLLKDVIQYAHERGVLFIAAAGRAGSDNDLAPNYPASYDVPNVVSVTSSERDDKLFGNFGRRTVDLAAPGLGLLST